MADTKEAAVKKTENTTQTTKAGTPVDVAAGDNAKDTTTETGVFYSSVKVFIAGILMFPLSVSIHSTFNETPTATVALPADVRLFNLGRNDRVPVQIFVMETMAEANQYILMFEGFITGRSYTNTAGQRQLVFNCAAFTEVFKDTKLKFMTSLDEAVWNDARGENNVAQTVFASDITFPTCLFYRGLGYNTDSNTMITMPTQYLANIMQYLEEAGSKMSPAGRFNDSIVSKYYATLAYNLHLDKRFCWLPYFDMPATEKGVREQTDTYVPYDSAWEAENITDADIEAGKVSVLFPVLYGVQTAEAMDLILQTLEVSSKEYSVHDLITYLIDRMEYDFLVIPNPAYQGKRTLDEDLGAKIDELHSATLSKDDLKDKEGINAESPTDQATISEMQTYMDWRYRPDRDCARLVNFCVKPILDDTFPPLCNVIFRSQVDSIQASNTFNGVPTRIQVTNLLPYRGHPGVTGVNSEPLSLYGTVDFYPSPLYGGSLAATEEGEETPQNVQIGIETRAPMSNELYANEQRTGPWITRDTAPNWLFYATNQMIFSRAQEGSDLAAYTKQVLKIREQYMRRQLMRAQILSRQLTAQCTFLPYVTCGFPAVIFDAANTGFAFTGNVIAIEHLITPTDMSTTVVLNGVRLLTEAQKDEEEGRYPNPINSVHVITHRKDRMSLIYNAILGTPEANTISGANAATWNEIIEKWYGPIDDVESSPQTNIYKAYQIQRRNIVNLDDYATFMNMTYNGTDLNSEWLRDRTKLTVFNEIPLLQRILPVTTLEKLKQEKSELQERQNILDEKVKQAKEARQEAMEAYNRKKAEYEAQKKDLQETIAKLNEAISKTETPSEELVHDYNVAAEKLYEVEINLKDYEKDGAATKKMNAVVKEQDALLESYAKDQKDIDEAAKTMNVAIEKEAEKAKKKKSGVFENFEKRDVRDLLTEVRNLTTKHQIYKLS